MLLRRSLEGIGAFVERFPEPYTRKPTGLDVQACLTEGARLEISGVGLVG